MAVVLVPSWAQSQNGAWVEGALTSGCGLGAICRPLTDWPWWRLGSCGGRASIRTRRAGPCAPAVRARRPLRRLGRGEEWPHALDFGLGNGSELLPRLRGGECQEQVAQRGA